MHTYNAIVVIIADLMIHLPVFHHIYTVTWIWRAQSGGEGGTTQSPPPPPNTDKAEFIMEYSMSKIRD